MRSLFFSILMLFLSFSQMAVPVHADHDRGCLPENTLNIPVNQGSLYPGLRAPDMDEDTFNAIIDELEKAYAPVVARKEAKLVIYRKWKNGEVNAEADRSGKEWRIFFYGGLARHPVVTQDAFQLVTCHEMGHHLGGAPRDSDGLSDEGEADYFATLKCLRRLWINEDNRAIMKARKVPSIVVRQCEKSFADANEIALCERMAMASLSHARLIQELDKSAPVSFATPDPKVVESTLSGHPSAQCRLDTHFQAALCQAEWSMELGESDPTIGACAMEKGDTFGYRPLCWYKP